MEQTNHKVSDAIVTDGHKAADQEPRPELVIADPLIDEEGWLALIDPAFEGKPREAEILAHRLYALREAIERGGAQAAGRVIESLDEGIKIAYQYTDTHRAALRLFYLYLAGEIIGDTPQELLEAAIQGAVCNRKGDDPRKDGEDDGARKDE